MPTSLRSRFWKAAIRLAFRDKDLSIPQERARSEQSGRFHPPFPKGLRVDEFALDGLRCAAIHPAAEIPGKVLLYLHGGGYVTGSIAASLMLCVPLSRSLSMHVVVPEYRLAPEHPYPAALDDALKAFRWLLAQGYAGSDIVMAGDSAGGGLCLSTVLALRDSGEPLPAALLCLSPWTDLSNAGASHTANAGRDVLLCTAMLDRWASCYASGRPLEDPGLSPINGDYHGCPPLCILADRSEILLDDSVNLARRAEAAGVDFSLSLWDGLWHVWPALGDLIPESEAAFSCMRQFLATRGVCAS